MNNKCIKFVENGYLILPVPSLFRIYCFSTSKYSKGKVLKIVFHKVKLVKQKINAVIIFISLSLPLPLSLSLSLTHTRKKGQPTNVHFLACHRKAIQALNAAHEGQLSIPEKQMWICILSISKRAIPSQEAKTLRKRGQRESSFHRKTGCSNCYSLFPPALQN